MNNIKIQINTIDKVKEFVKVINTFEGNVDIIQGRYVIDAKSIMGIFSLNLTEPLYLHLQNFNVADHNKILELVKEFLD